MKTYIKVKDGNPPNCEKGYTVCHSNLGPMYMWWVPDAGVWEDAEEYQCGPKEIVWWLNEVKSPTPKAEEEEIIHILKPKYLSKDGAIKDGFQVGDKWYAPKNDLPQAPKAVTDGEIEEAARNAVKQKRGDTMKSAKRERFIQIWEEGAKWMREQQGEGAKDRYEKAKSHILRYYKYHEISQAHWDGYKIASGLTDKQ